MATLTRTLAVLGLLIFIAPNGLNRLTSDNSGEEADYEALPDGIFLHRSLKGGGGEFLFERDGQTLVRVTIPDPTATAGFYALKICGPDKYGAERIVIRIPPTNGDPAANRHLEDPCQPLDIPPAAGAS